MVVKHKSEKMNQMYKHSHLSWLGKFRVILYSGGSVYTSGSSFRFYV